MAEVKSCQYEQWDKTPCPHSYLTTWKDPETGEEKHYCIFHAPMEVKAARINEFWDKFERYLEDTKKLFEEAPGKTKDTILFSCRGFVFPNTGRRFHSLKFPFRVVFDKALFTSNASFFYTTFEKSVDFSQVRFEGVVNFTLTIFLSEGTFERTLFKKDSYFNATRFFGETTFVRATFYNNADFSNSSVTKTLKIYLTDFHGRVDFRYISSYSDYEHKTRGPGKILLNNVYFHQPKRSIFGGNFATTNFLHWSFSGTNIENSAFFRAAWPSRFGYVKSILLILTLGLYKPRGRKYIYDEILAKKKDGLVTWEEASEVYRRLRLNYESKLAYETAGDFHYGEMECRRRDGNRPWWDRTITWFYKKLFSYGESISKPLFWLVISFLLFTGFFLLHGFPLNDGLAINWDWGFGKLLVGSWWKQLGSGMLFTIRSAFSFNVPEGGTNSLAAIMSAWKLVAVTLATFFVLALRRRFKR